MSNTKKDKAKIMRKISRKQNPLPPEKIVSPNKKKYKRKPKRPKVYEVYSNNGFITVYTGLTVTDCTCIR